MSESAYNSPLPLRRFTDSCCSSPARSIGGRSAGRGGGNGSDSDGENDLLAVEVPGPPDQTIMSGWLKFRDHKKWKQRWGVITKLSPAAAFGVLLFSALVAYAAAKWGDPVMPNWHCLHLQLYRDSKDRYKQGHTKASLSLQHFLGLETGFTLDKESNTVAILCEDVVVVLAFDNRERLMQWQVKLSTHLGDGPHFLVLLSSAPPKAKLSVGPARLHVQEKGFCLSTGCPPRLACHWLISNLRRYGVIEGRFCFEGGSRCGKGEGLYVLITDQGEEITNVLKLAATGQLHSSRRRPVSRNMSVMDSPRRPPLRAEVRNPEIQDLLLLSRVDSPYTDLDSNYSCGDTNSTDGWAGPPMERCMSCISKLGAMSRSSTATITPAKNTCWEHTCDVHSISSSSDSSGWSQNVPVRPPKPNLGSPLKKEKMPLPSYDNYDIPKLPYPIKTDEHYDTPRKIKDCLLLDAVQKPCGCIFKMSATTTSCQTTIAQAQKQTILVMDKSFTTEATIERPCVCQRLLFTCWGEQEQDINALYAQVDFSKKCRNINHNYANVTVNKAPTKSTPKKGHSDYENMEFVESLELYENAKQVVQKAGICTKCGHTSNDYLMMEPQHQQQLQHNTSSYLPMSPAMKQRIEKLLSSSNPNLTKPSGSSMLQNNIYQRKRLLDSTDNLVERRKRSNSADSSSRFPIITVNGSDSGQNSGSPGQGTDLSTSCTCVKRSSSVPCKSNRDSSSSNDSGVFELPRKFFPTLPRRSKSSDPLKDLSFNFGSVNGKQGERKSSSAEAEVPLCPNGSTSSGTSDMSDYFETLSLSSHSSNDVPLQSCTLRPRSGNEYLSLQRLIAPVPEERLN